MHEFDGGISCALKFLESLFSLVETKIESSETGNDCEGNLTFVVQCHAFHEKEGCFWHLVCRMKCDDFVVVLFGHFV